MQMLQQYLGEQGARYATFVLVALGLLIAVLVVWVLIRKALGSRLNFSEKPDRRGRTPRLGITESFNVDREGRRLVIVRRDNFEHLVMIGGPNDVVIETTILRGERLTVGRNDQRTAESELIPAMPRQITETLQPALAAPLPQPTVQLAPSQKTMPQPIPAAPKPVLRQPERVPSPPVPVVPPKVEIKLPEPAAATAPAFVSAPVSVSAPAPIVAPIVIMAPPSFQQPKAPIVDMPNSTAPMSALPIQSVQMAAATAAATVETSSQSVAANAKAAVKKMLSSSANVDEAILPVSKASLPDLATQGKTLDQPVTAKPTLAERIKSGGFFSKKAVVSEPPPAPVTVSKSLPEVNQVKLPEIETPVPTKLAPAITMPSAPPLAKPSGGAFMAEMKTLEEATRVVKSPTAGFGDSLLAETKAPEAPKIPQTLRPRPPVPAPPQAPEPVTAQQAPAPVRSVSKNPFDSLEEEMAKLLGRTPDGKG